MRSDKRSPDSGQGPSSGLFRVEYLNVTQSGKKDPSVIRRGDTLAEIYQVLSDAHKGGMGAVWKVTRREWPDISLAMKRPKPDFFQTEKQKADFIRECENWINLGLHPNIVTCYYVSEIDGVPTIFSEWMENGSLEEHIREGSLYDGTKEAVRERLLDIAIQFARGLHFAHLNGLVHQDVKPDNLLLTREWDAKVSDFGIARARSLATALEGDWTQPEFDIGTTQMAPGGGMTPAYCSPEQAARQLLTQRTDIYSWAVSVLEMYLGYKPWSHNGIYSGPMVGIVCRDYFEMCTEHPIPEALRELLVGCLEQNPDQRPHDFEQVEAELLRIYRNETHKNYPRDSAEGIAVTADSLNNQAVSYLEIGQDDNALRCLEKAHSIDPNHAETMYNRALFEWRKGICTDMEVCRRLMNNPYFSKTEAGRQALRDLAKEAGKTSMDAQLMGGISGRSFAVKRLGNDEGFHYHVYLRHDKIYFTYVLFRKDLWSTAVEMKVFDTMTGQELSRDDFANAQSRKGRIVVRPVEAVLTGDCSKAMLHMSDDSLILYDIAGRSVIRRYDLKKGGFPHSDLKFVGESARFFSSHVFMSGDELYDLRDGKLIEGTYTDWELIQAGSDRPLPPPKGDRYRRSLSDGRRAIPIYYNEKELWYCDTAGNPVAPISPALAVRLEQLPLVRYTKDKWKRVLRITEDRRIWLTCDDGLMEFDLVSGKCLRSYSFYGIKAGVSIDPDGLGISTVRWDAEALDDKNETAIWYYTKLDPIRTKDRAPWRVSEPENYARYQDRMEHIAAVAEAFGRAEAAEDTVTMCAIYEEAVRIRCFYGTTVQRDMKDRLDRLCIQKDGAFFLHMQGHVKAEGNDREEILAPYGLGKPLPDDLMERILKQSWVSDEKAISVSPDGRRALIASYQWSDESCRPPVDPGIYLLNVETEKLYFLKQYEGRYSTAAGFCRDRRHIVYGDAKTMMHGSLLRYADISDGSSRARDVGKWEPMEDTIFNCVMLSMEPVPGTGGDASILWETNAYTFRTEALRQAFLDQTGESLQILDASDSYGLIVYVNKSRTKEYVLRVWSVDEERILMETPVNDSREITARFGLTDSGEIRLLVAREGLSARGRESYPVEIYQFRCIYGSEKPRRLPAMSPGEWPEIGLPECKL